MASSDSNARDELWARHYRVASERRRARGWHRRDQARARTLGRRGRRLRVYVGLAVVFAALTIVALLFPR